MSCAGTLRGSILCAQAYSGLICSIYLVVCLLEIGMEDLKARAVRGGFAKLCGQAGNLALRLGFLVIMARLLDPEDFGLVAMVTVVTGVYEHLYICRAFVGRHPESHRHRRTDFNAFLDQHSCRDGTCPAVLSDGTSARCLLSRASSFLGHRGDRHGVFVLCGGGAAFCASSTPVAVRRPDSDRNAVLTSKLCAWNRHGCRWIWILGSGRFDNRFASRQYRLDVGDRGVDTRHAAPRSGYSLDVAFWRHHYSE